MNSKGVGAMCEGDALRLAFDGAENIGTDGDNGVGATASEAVFASIKVLASQVGPTR